MLFVKVPTDNFHGFGYSFSNNIGILKLSWEIGKIFAIRYLVEALLVITVNFSHCWLVNGQQKVNRKGLVNNASYQIKVVI